MLKWFHRNMKPFLFGGGKVKKIYVFCIILLCLSLSACSNVREGILFSPSIKDRTDAVADIQNIERSTTEITDNTEFTFKEGLYL